MCLFCKIVTKEIPAKIMFEDDDLVAFHDINPGAPTHVLLIPKQHITGLSEVKPEEQAIVGKLLLAAPRVAEQAGVAQSGYRVVITTAHTQGRA